MNNNRGKHGSHHQDVIITSLVWEVASMSMQFSADGSDGTIGCGSSYAGGLTVITTLTFGLAPLCELNIVRFFSRDDKSCTGA